jgi:hypothetical protein
VDIGNTIDNPGGADGIIRPPPKLAGHRDTRRCGAVNIGVVSRLKIAVVPSGAREHAQILRNLLL